ncbi:polysaccharide deacetylase family protein [Thermodesulfobacteriota bacterium]
MQTAYAVLYHDVTDDPKTSGFQNAEAYIYTHSVDHFLSDLEVLLNSLPDHVIRNISFNDCLPDIDAGLLLTFDDGGNSGMYIADELEALGLCGFFLMTTRMLGDSYFLTAGELRQLDQRGHKIGVHTHNHFSPFKNLSYTDKVDEWKHSCSILEDTLGHSVVIGSIPGGTMDSNTIKSAAEAGLKLLFTSEPTRRIRYCGSMAVIGRICPKRSTSKSFLKWAVSSKTLLPITLMWHAKAFVKSCINLGRRKHYIMEPHLYDGR